MTTHGSYGAEALERPSSRAHDGDGRTPFQKDRDRLLYSSFFRKMAGKTQVVASTERGNFHTRLTHSLKVAQIGRRIAERAGHEVDPDLVETACLAHDIGHPPFGHAGEAELRRCCELAAQQQGADPGAHTDAFEGNAQNLRIVADLAVHYPQGVADGLDFTRATLDAMTKYGWMREVGNRKWGIYPAECELSEWITGHPPAVGTTKSVEAELMDWADDVTFACHDVEDFYRAGLIPLDRLLFRQGPLPENDYVTEEAHRYLDWYMPKREHELANPASRGDVEAAWLDLARRVDSPFPYRGDRASKAQAKGNTSKLIGRFVNSVEVEGCRRAGEVRLAADVDEARIIRLQNNLLKNLVFFYVIEEPNLALLQAGQARIVRDLFQAFYDGPDSLFPLGWRERLDGAASTRLCVARDYVASLTEADAFALHRLITGLEAGSVLNHMKE